MNSEFHSARLARMQRTRQNSVFVSNTGRSGSFSLEVHPPRRAVSALNLTSLVLQESEEEHAFDTTSPQIGTSLNSARSHLTLSGSRRTSLEPTLIIPERSRRTSLEPPLIIQDRSRRTSLEPPIIISPSMPSQNLALPVRSHHH
ncbi:unnamed protein product, partial [Meganyctiphanes norvegica]